METTLIINGLTRNIQSIDRVIEYLVKICACHAQRFSPGDEIINVCKEMLNNYIKIRNNYEKLKHYYEEMLEEP